MRFDQIRLSLLVAPLEDCPSDRRIRANLRRHVEWGELVLVAQHIRVTTIFQYRFGDVCRSSPCRNMERRPQSDITFEFAPILQKRLHNLHMSALRRKI